MNLTTLDLANNQIKKLENVCHLVNLEEFWVNEIYNRISGELLSSIQFNHNSFEDWSALSELKNMKRLRTVYFEGNSISTDPQYRRKIQLTLPSVTQIDATLVPKLH